jgi:1-acyl-sn-glycerol-3-phosphate acyltransferase
VKALITFIRSLAFTIVMCTVTFFYSFLCVLAKPLPAPFRYRMITAWTSFIIASAKHLCGIHYQVKGMENIPKDNAIIFSKHQSTWETFLLPILFHQPTIILKKELLRIPFFGWGLSILDPIAIDRNNKKSALEQMIQQGKASLEQGRFILCFPEGTRTQPGEKVKYKLGAAKLAEATKAKVIPVAHNAGTLWPKKGFMKKAGTITVSIGPCIDTTRKTPIEIMDEARTWVENEVDGMVE